MKIKAIVITLMSSVVFLPLLAISSLTGRDYQKEIAEEAIKAWKHRI